MDKGSMVSTASAVNRKEVPHNKIRHNNSDQLTRTKLVFIERIVSAQPAEKQQTRT